MNKTITIPYKKLQPSPQFKPYVAGEGCTLKELNQRITEISATGGGGGGQRIVVSPDMPTDLKENDFWYEEKLMQTYVAFVVDSIPHFLIVSDSPIDSSQDNSIYINDKLFPIAPAQGLYFENLGIMTSELYHTLTTAYGFDLPSDIIGQYACVVAQEFFVPLLKKGSCSVFFKIGNEYSRTITFDVPGFFLFTDVTDSNTHILISNAQYSLSQLQSGTLTILKDGQEGDYSQYFNFNSGTELIDDAYIEETGIMAIFKGVFASKLQISDNTPVGEYEISYELDGISTIESAYIIVV